MLAGRARPVVLEDYLPNPEPSATEPSGTQVLQLYATSYDVAPVLAVLNADARLPLYLVEVLALY